MQRRETDNDELVLLSEVLERQAPDRSDLYCAVESKTLTSTQRRELCELITKEFTATGLGNDDEPTARGLALERLLDVVNRPNLKPSG